LISISDGLLLYGDLLTHWLMYPAKQFRVFFEKLKCPHYLRFSPAGAYPPCDSRYVLGTVLVKSDRSFGEGRGKGFPPSSEVSAN